MLSKDIQKKLNFITTVVSTYKILMLPSDWWYSSTMQNDGYIKMIDLWTENKDEIESFLTEHNISCTLNKRRKVFIYQIKPF